VHDLEEITSRSANEGNSESRVDCIVLDDDLEGLSCGSSGLCAADGASRVRFQPDIATVPCGGAGESSDALDKVSLGCAGSGDETRHTEDHDGPGS
jgi:hypothetical protein